MTKRLDRHPGNLVIFAVRAWFLEAVREWCPEVLEDLRRAVYVPLEARVGRDDAAVLLFRRSPLPVDHLRGSVHREVRAGILRWARRSRLDTVWIRDEAWRTLRFWAAHPRAARGAGGLRWAPLINTRPLAGAPPVRRPRNGVVVPGGFGLFQRLDEGHQSAVVDAPPVLRRGDREADGQMGLAHPPEGRGR